jgi:AraC-like DNA-binding protein
MKEAGIQQLNLTDVPQLSGHVKYFDGEIGFADDIRSVVTLADAFKVNFVAMIFCTQGTLSVRVNSVKYDINANDGLLIDMQSVVSDISYDSEMSCKIICITLEGGITFMTKSVFEAFLRVKQNPVVHFSDDEVELMSRYYELALFKMEHPTVGSSGKETMHTILRAYVLDVIANLTSHYGEGDDETIMRQGDKIFHRFILMLAKSNGAQRSVKDYADELCVSSKYLTSICRKHENKTASDLIALNTVGHIKQMLLYSTLSIKEIALQLGFDNLSFFGKYVKKHLGYSPNNFRKINGYGK